MRILFLASYFPRPSKPAIGTWALEQAKALARVSTLQVVCCTSYVPAILGVLPRARPWTQVPATHQWDNVSATYLKALYYPISPFKKSAHVTPSRQMNLAWNSIKKRAFQIVREFSPDVIYAHHTAVNGFFAERIRRETRIPFVVTDHDFAEIADCERLLARRAFFEPIIDAAHRNVCVATRMQNDLQRIFPRARAVTIHNGINPHPAEIFQTPRPPELQNKKILFSAGMFVPRKGFPLLIEAFFQIAAAHPAAILRIGGDGPQRPEIEATIQRLNMTARVQLLGLLPQKRIFQEMAWSDAFPLVSWDEPFATVYIEAMGAGVPIVTASDGGINDVVRDRIHGLVVPPKDVTAAAAALNELLTNEDARRTMGQNARALVDDQLTWTANAHRMTQLFEEAAAARA